MSVFERLVEVKEQEIYDPWVSAENMIGGQSYRNTGGFEKW